MASSVSHPRSVIWLFTVQSPSQLGLKALMPPRWVPPPPPPPTDTPLLCPSRATWPSYSMPSGLVPNTNAFWLSLNVSIAMTTESVSLNEASRRDCDTMIFDGSLSKAITLMYRVPLPIRTRTSVFSLAGAPSTGSCCVKVAYGCTVCHTASFTLPSITGDAAESASLPTVKVGGGGCWAAAVAGTKAAASNANRRQHA